MVTIQQQEFYRVKIFFVFMFKLNKFVREYLFYFKIN